MDFELLDIETHICLTSHRKLYSNKVLYSNTFGRGLKKSPVTLVCKHYSL